MKFEIDIKGEKRKIEIKENNNHVSIKIGSKDFKFQKNNKKEEEISVAQTNIPKKKFEKKEIKAPIAGTITKIFVQEGEEFKKDQKIASLSAMKMENEIVSDFKGKIKKILVKQNQKVQEGEVLVVLK
jgi:biotin carboxyl carrier protein